MASDDMPEGQPLDVPALPAPDPAPEVEALAAEVPVADPAPPEDPQEDGDSGEVLPVPSPAPLRLPDWQQRLSAWLTGEARRPLVYGRHDCALFAAGAVEAMTGVDFAAPFRGRYTTLRGGIRVLRRAGFDDHVALARHLFPSRPAAFAMPGDLAVLDSGEAGAGALSLGVVQGAQVYVLQPWGGLGLVPLITALETLAV